MTGPVLAFDAAGKHLLVALKYNGELFSRVSKQATGQAKQLTASIAEVLAEAEVSAKDIERIIVGRGPGSFTGIRIAMATAIGIVSASPSAKLSGVSAFDVQYSAFRRNYTSIGEELLILVDSRREALFAQRYDPNGCKVDNAHLLKICAVETLEHVGVVSGDGVERIQLDDSWNHSLLRPIEIEPVDLFSAAVGADFSRNPDSVRPFYLRAPDTGPQTDNKLK